MISLYCYFSCSNSITQNKILQTIFFGILCSIVAVLIYNFCQSFGLYLKMKKINGTYFEFDDRGIQKENSKCTVRFKLKLMILLGSGSYIQIKQINEKRGLWESRLPLSASNPLMAVGTYKYLASKTWGVLNITINLKDDIIFVRAEDKIKKEEDRKVAQYWLKKES